ncbi:MAG: zf-HC2 domain-containing protein [Kofleriaceae bacterium]|jgi:anti-sigma factor RsiW|nr:zf-HC2 domain-containing protein [Kofleriaceae bacterium]MBP9168557.1 zf-HC2 domain-containing protein [Kofleriaceae bacterium]MBP9859243.1 zf-HC2 domain-containing protein [Kofleriaceae bacterium]
MTDPASTDERLAAMLSDYVDGTLAPADRAEVEAALAADPALRAEVDELRASVGALKSLPPTAAPPDLGKSVEERIHRRSAGRFFARRTLGDRVPFGVLLIVALIALVILLAVLWSSPTGSLKRPPPAPPEPPAESLLPRHQAPP